MTMNTVENFINLDLDFDIRMNMQGLTALVNAVGSVTVHNDMRWEDPRLLQKGLCYVVWVPVTSQKILFHKMFHITQAVTVEFS